MKTFMIKLTTIADVQKFVTTVTLFESDVDIVSGRYIVDAKSILGLLSLDLSKPLEVNIYSCTEDIEKQISQFVA